MLAVKGIVAEGVVDLPGELSARVRAAGPSGLPTVVLPAADVRGSGLVDAALLLFESSGGAAGLAAGDASSGAAPKALAAPSRRADARAFEPARRQRRSCREHDA